MFNHPKKVCMSYIQHLKLSLYFSYILFKGSLKAIVHGLVPDVYVTSTSDLSIQLRAILDKSGCR